MYRVLSNVIHNKKQIAIKLFAASTFGLVFVFYIINTFSGGHNERTLVPIRTPFMFDSQFVRNGEEYKTEAKNNQTYYFKPPPYNIDDPLDMIILKDVCIERVPNSERSEIKIYNRKKDIKGQLTTHGRVWFGYLNWNVTYTTQKIPNERRYMPAPAYFSIQNFPTNVFHFFEDGIRGLYSMFVETGRMGATEGNYIFTFHCHHGWNSSEITKNKLYEVFYKMSPNLTYMGCPEEPLFTDVCFRHGVFGFIRRLEGDRLAFTSHIKNVMGISNITCPSKPRIVFLDRSYRRAANTVDMVDSLKTLGLNNTIIEIVKFENVSVFDQMAKIHCTNILIGVHGAGMAWFQFLPAEAAVLELGWHYWWPNQWRYMAKRRGLFGDVLSAEHNVTIDWNKLMQIKRVTSMTDEEKRSALKDTDPMWMPRNPYRVAQGHFSISRFLRKMKKLISDLEQKFHLPFRRLS